MKKYLLILTVVILALSTSAMAAGHVELRVAPDDVNQAGYQSSDTITIQLYATDFYTEPPNDTVSFMDIAAILTDNNGIASAPSLHSELAAGTGSSPGTIVNSGGVLISNIAGYMLTGDLDGVTPFPAVLHEFEFHVPDLPLSSSTTISLDTLELWNIGYNSITPAYTEGEPLEIHMPCCPGDTDNDGDIDIDDYYRFLSDLSYALWLCSIFGPAVDSPGCDIYPGNPITGFLWDPCLDLESDGDIDIDDYYKILGDLSYAYYLTGLTGPPDYIITPAHPDTGFLWPCN